MKYTAHQHNTHVIKVETKDRVICDAIGDMETAERIALGLNLLEAGAEAKLSERKTVHEWLNQLGVAREEHGKPVCLLRRLAIALKVND